MFVTRFATGRQPEAHAFSATTIESARMEATVVSTEPARIFVAGERSKTRTPPSSAAARKARTRRPGCTVAPSRKNTPPRKTGDEQKAATSLGDKARAS